MHGIAAIDVHIYAFRILCRRAEQFKIKFEMCCAQAACNCAYIWSDSAAVE